MVKNHAIRLITLLVIAFVTGCYMPRLQRDQSYPADWPDIQSLGPECSDLDGTYGNDGTMVGTNGSKRTVLLTDILLRRQLSAEAKTVTLKVRKQKFGLASYRTLQIDVDYGKGMRDNFSLGGVGHSFYSKGALIFGSHDRETSILRYIYLTRAPDGSLIVKIRIISRYIVFFFFAGGDYKRVEYSEWARFNSVVD